MNPDQSIVMDLKSYVDKLMVVFTLKGVPTLNHFKLEVACARLPQLSQVGAAQSVGVGESWECMQYCVVI